MSASAASAASAAVANQTFEKNNDDNVEPNNINLYKEFIMSKEQEIRKEFPDYSDDEIEIIKAYYIHALEYSDANKFIKTDDLSNTDKNSE